MSDNKIIIGDEMIQAQLEENSKKLGISIDELIDRYIKLGLFTDDYYNPPKLSKEELIEISKKEVEKDMKNGIPPKKHNFGALVGKFNRFDV